MLNDVYQIKYQDCDSIRKYLRRIRSVAMITKTVMFSMCSRQGNVRCHNLYVLCLLQRKLWKLVLCVGIVYLLKRSFKEQERLYYASLNCSRNYQTVIDRDETCNNVPHLIKTNDLKYNFSNACEYI